MAEPRVVGGSDVAILIRVFLAFLFVGWLIPLWVGVDQILTNSIANAIQRADSFPHLQFAKTMFKITAVWLLVSAFSSAWMLLTMLQKSGAASPTE